jgi:NADH-quinone oxidoreductase subunit H
MLIIFIFMWVRWSLPRFRFDQLMQLAWRAMIPISLALVLVTAVVIYLAGPISDVYKRERRLDGFMALAMLIANVILLAATMIISRLLPVIDTNKRMRIAESRFTHTPLPAGVSNN